MLNLDPALYVSSDAFSRERQSIFRRTWQMLGPVAQVEERGQYVAADIAGDKVFVIRARDGQLKGFRNVCRHRGAMLLPDGTGKCATIRCPYHQWVYDDHGNLINAPWFGEDPDFRREDWPLHPIHVETWRGILFAAIDPSKRCIEQLGEVTAELADEPIETYNPAGNCPRPL